MGEIVCRLPLGFVKNKITGVKDAVWIGWNGPTTARQMYEPLKGSIGIKAAWVYA